MEKTLLKKVTCLGAGYVGGNTLSVLAKYHSDIDFYCADLNEKKISAWNSKNLKKLPVYEKGLPEIIKKTRGKNLFFTSNVPEAIKDSDIVFVSVNTPTKKTGEGAGMSSDLKYFESCAEMIGKHMNKDLIVVEKSTVPVKTADLLKKIIKTYNSKYQVTVLSNPEFLAEGTAINNLEDPDRILIGHNDDKHSKQSANVLRNLFSKWVDVSKILLTNVWSSELSKLISNAFLAQRISSINSISAICEKTGADIEEISKAIGMDTRIGPKFLNTSVGFGGSCFQKDILNLIYISQHYGLKEVADYWENVLKINDYQRKRFVKNIIGQLNSTVSGKKISILGWAFKKDTNDTRESSSIYIANALLQENAVLDIYDPKVSKEQIINDLGELHKQNADGVVSKHPYQDFNSKIKISTSLVDCLKDSRAALILTEWDEFKNADWDTLIDQMDLSALVFDGRRVVPQKALRKNNRILAIGSKWD